MTPRDPKYALAPRAEFAAWADAMPLAQILPELHEQILRLEAPRACALAHSYLARTDERDALLETVVYAACHFQNDPHVLRNCTSWCDEETLAAARAELVARGSAWVPTANALRLSAARRFGPTWPSLWRRPACRRSP